MTSYRPVNLAPENYWTASRAANLSDAAIEALLESGEITPDETVALEAEQERRNADDDARD